MVKCPALNGAKVEMSEDTLNNKGLGNGASSPSQGRMRPSTMMIQSTVQEHKRLGSLREQEIEQQQKERELLEKERLQKLLENNRLLANEKVWKAIKWTVALFAATWVVSQMVSLIMIVENSFGVAKYFAWVAVAFIVIICIWCVVLACIVFGSLPRIGQSIKAKNGMLHDEEKLKKYVEDLGKKFKNDGSYGVIVSEKAEKCLRELNGGKDFGGERDGWLHCFETLQEEQVKCANECVKRYAKLVGVGTATCPWKAGDVFIVFSSSISLVCEIARIFNRIDVNRYVAFRLIRGWLSQMYVAGHIQDVSELAVSKIDVSDGNHLADAADSWADILGTFAEPLKKVMGKVSEGAVNGFLCYRFGKMAIKEFSQLRYESELRKS